MKKLIIALALLSTSAAAFAAPAPAAPVTIADGQYNCEQGGFFVLKGASLVFDGDDANEFHPNKVQDMEGVIQYSSPKGGAQLSAQDKDSVFVNFGHGAEDICHKFVEQPKVTFKCDDGATLWYSWAQDHSEAVGEYNNAGNNVGFIVRPLVIVGNDFKAQLTYGANVIGRMDKAGSIVTINDGNGPITCKFAGNK